MLPVRYNYNWWLFMWQMWRKLHVRRYNTKNNKWIGGIMKEDTRKWNCPHCYQEIKDKRSYVNWLLAHVKYSASLLDNKYTIRTVIELCDELREKVEDLLNENINKEIEYLRLPWLFTMEQQEIAKDLEAKKLAYHKKEGNEFILYMDSRLCEDNYKLLKEMYPNMTTKKEGKTFEQVLKKEES